MKTEQELLVMFNRLSHVVIPIANGNTFDELKALESRASTRLARTSNNYFELKDAVAYLELIQCAKAAKRNGWVK